MPFFFFVSGIFFSYNKRFIRYSIDKFDVLVKPFVSITLIYLTLKLVVAGSIPTLYRVRGMFYGTGDSIGSPWTPMWFLPHLWVVFVFSCATLKIVNYDKQKLFLKCIFLSMLMFLGSNFIAVFWNLDVNFLGFRATLPGLPFSLDLVLLTSFYFILGYTTRRFVVVFKPNQYLFFLGCLFIYVSAYHLGAGISLNRRIINNPIFSIPSSLIGIYCALTISEFISKLAYMDKVFLVMGRYSLFILIFHVVIYQIIVQKIFGMHMSNLEVIISLLSCIIFSILIGIAISRNAFLSLFFNPLRTNNLFQRTSKLAAE